MEKKDMEINTVFNKIRNKMDLTFIPEVSQLGNCCMNMSLC